MVHGRPDAGLRFTNSTTAGSIPTQTTDDRDTSAKMQPSLQNTETVPTVRLHVNESVANQSSMLRDFSQPSAPFTPYRSHNPPSMNSRHPASSSTHPPPLHGPHPLQNQPYGPFVAPPQPPLGVESVPGSFTYPSAYVHQGQQETGPVSSPLHPSYPSILHPAAPVYPFQQRPPDGTTHFSGTSPRSPSFQPRYPHPNQYPSAPHRSTGGSSATPQASVNPPLYPRKSQFPPVNYPSSTNSPYGYYMQPYPPSQMYPAPYPPPFEPNFGPMSDSDARQVGWWYPSHTVPVPPQFKGGPAAYPPYPGPSLLFRPIEPSYSSGPSPTSSQPLSPIRPQSQPSPTHSSLSPSPRIHGPSLSASPHPASTSLKEKPVKRRSYHPNPPAYRSEWVMWVGNVPLNATHDELWRFFNKSASSEDDPAVLSIFLISRSNCAFVNYASEHHLTAAIARFNGKELRTADSRCPKLVCRVRKKEDDLTAGVGGQRGSGIHTNWIKEQKAKQEKGMVLSGGAAPGVGVSAAQKFGLRDPVMANIEGSSTFNESEAQKRQSRQSSSFDSTSGSFASTNSSFLARYFPKRYFILKSLTQFDLDLSVEKGLWATQKHNEGILDQAYRTSQDVYLIFSVNKSGEFYGYARMAGRIRHGEHSVSWVSRATDSQQSIGSISAVNRDPPSSDADPNLKAPSQTFFSPGSNRLVRDSPMEMQSGDIGPAIPTPTTPEKVLHQDPQSAPAEFGAATRRYSLQAPAMHHSLNLGPRVPDAPVAPSMSPVGGEEDFELDPAAPIRAIRSPEARESALEEQQRSGSGGQVTTLQSVAEEEEKPEAVSPPETKEKLEDVVQGARDEQARGETWGESFKIVWLATEKLPFNRTRHLRNQWNHDREVKVSRDGTELEPTVGQKLLDEWARLRDPEMLGKVVGGTFEKGMASVPLPVKHLLGSVQG